ncbi:MAG TPA: peptide deformylase [Gaiellaceae bacterium]|jgi:peptide deformylase|nr:peptide deformylase [Gaiellaceae bacterium]
MADEHDHAHDHSEHDHAHDHSAHEHDHDHDHDDADQPTEADLERERQYVRRYALSQIRQYPDPALRMRAREVTEFDEFLMQLAERMFSLMGDAQGVGLAATQVGTLQRVFVFELEDQGPQAVVNPVLSNFSEEKATDEEGCLSLEEIRVPVERSTKVTLDGVNPAGEPVHLELEGLSARVVQHEIDHLDGVLIIDRTDAEHRKQALGELRPQTVLR